MNKKLIFLITGITGSGGSYLADYLLDNITDHEIEIHGTTRWHSAAISKFDLLSSDKVKLHFCDLLDLSCVIQLLDEVKPTHIFHLASLTNIKDSFINPLSTINNNVMITANLLEAVHLSKLDPIIQICSTSEVYGQPTEENIPSDELCPIKPINPYAVSKLTQDMLGYSYFRCYRLKIIITRSFGYINPRRDDLVITSFAKQIVEIEQGKRDKLYHGDLTPLRTFMDVRDVSKAYWLLMLYGKYGEVYNIGIETPRTIQNCLDTLISQAKCPIITEEHPALLRPSDIFKQVPCITKFKNTVPNWNSTYTFEESVQFLLETRRKLQNGKT